MPRLTAPRRPTCPKRPEGGWSLADLAALGYCGAAHLDSAQAQASPLYGSPAAARAAYALGVAAAAPPNPAAVPVPSGRPAAPPQLSLFGL